LRVVFDTNIYISAFAIPGGDAEDAFLHAVGGKFELLISIPILAETAKVLQTKFDWSSDRVQQLIFHLSQSTTLVEPSPRLHVLQDEPDNRILECAVASHADFIVTGDRHLLDLGQYGSAKVIRLTEFLTLLR
jgi:putative PIN family toxin of toxin-antitoxin system